jgi:hypothetical protein
MAPKPAKATLREGCECIFAVEISNFVSKMQYFEGAVLELYILSPA